MQPESSDGLASVGTILPERKELPCCRAALSVLLRFPGPPGAGSVEFVTSAEILDTYLFLAALKSGTVLVS